MPKKSPKATKSHEQCPKEFSSEKLEKAGTVDFKKIPHRRSAQGLVQCGPNVSGRFAFPGARNHRIYSISRFGKNFPAIFLEFSRNFPPELPQRPQKRLSSFLISESFEGTAQQNKGFGANRTRKFTQKAMKTIKKRILFVPTNPLKSLERMEKHSKKLEVFSPGQFSL